MIKEREGEQYIHAAKHYYMEMNTAAMLKELDVAYDVPQIEIESRIRGIEKSTGMELDQLQAQAVIEAACNGLMVITGGQARERPRPSMPSYGILSRKGWTFF